MSVQQPDLSYLPDKLSKAVSHYWLTRNKQRMKQQTSGRTDQGFRGAATGGAQMNGFIQLVSELIASCGYKTSEIYYQTKLELPGYFRPTKEWDILVVRGGKLVLAAEMKSQVGPSFGNNFNNRTEEAMGSALDLWTAYREGAYQTSQPWLGYFFMLEDCPRSRSAVRVNEPHFKVFPEFCDSSYAKRYEIFCRKLVLERHYTASAFLLSDGIKGLRGEYLEPASDLSFMNFIKSLISHAIAYR